MSTVAKTRKVLLIHHKHAVKRIKLVLTAPNY